MYTEDTLKECRTLINDVRTDIKNGHREMADMQLDYINKMLGAVIREQLDLDLREARFKGHMEGVEGVEKRLDTIFSSTPTQLAVGECNLTT
jgi:hypothetical protein